MNKNPEKIKNHLKKDPPKKPLKTSFSIKENPNLGVRKAMEDFTITLEDILGDKKYSFYCILDGHGGHTISHYIKKSYPKLLKMKLKTYQKAYKIQNIIKMTLENIESQIKMIGGRNCGSTFCGIFLDKINKKYYTINIGDSRCLKIAWDFSKNNLKSVFLTEEHKISNVKEKERILKKGGSVVNGRLGGNLMISRSLGDFDMKKFGLISTPDIEEFFVEKRLFLVLASDGIWDVVDRRGCEEVLRGLAEGEGIDEFAQGLVDKAVKLGSLDNISLIVVMI